MSKHIQVEFVFQDLHNLPEGFTVPEGRVKPWGTGHAVLSCLNEIGGPFVVINADDYYGTHAFKMAYDFLIHAEEESVPAQYMMVGYRLENTLTDNGYVSAVSARQTRTDILQISMRELTLKNVTAEQLTQRTMEKHGQQLPVDAPVSMNMWGFTGGFMKELEARFPVFLEKNIPVNPLKCEYFLPFVVDELLKEKKATVKVLTTQD